MCQLWVCIYQFDQNARENKAQSLGLSIRLWHAFAPMAGKRKNILNTLLMLLWHLRIGQRMWWITFISQSGWANVRGFRIDWAAV
jgi:hypothetical protein